MKIRNLEIGKLFGRFDYFFSFEEESNNLFMFHGYNGAGKTKVLSIIDALCRRDFVNLSKLNCEHIKLTYSNNSTLVVEKKTSTSTRKHKDKDNRRIAKPLFEEQTSFEVALIKDGKATPIKKEGNRGVRGVNPGLVAQLDRYIPYLNQVGPYRWRHIETGRHYSLAEVLQECSDILPSGLVHSINSQLGHSEGQDAGVPFLKTRFINTRRLDYANFISEKRAYWDPDELEEASVSSPLLNLSKRISESLKITLNNYAIKSQQLDSEFPHSLLMPDFFSGHDKQAVSDKLKRLKEKAQSLSEAGILEEQKTLDINLDSIIDKHLVSILDRYCSNTEDKLVVFEDIYRKISLLTEIINKRFRFKKIRIDKTGIVVIDTDRNQTIGLDALSSGEQHELYLFADLIFNQDTPDVILIDEPEISLHVEWQESFVDDLLRIDALKRSQIFIATHSPSIIGNHWEKSFDLAAQYTKA